MFYMYFMRLWRCDSFLESWNLARGFNALRDDVYRITRSQRSQWPQKQHQIVRWMFHLSPCSHCKLRFIMALWQEKKKLWMWPLHVVRFFGASRFSGFGTLSKSQMPSSLWTKLSTKFRFSLCIRCMASDWFFSVATHGGSCGTRRCWFDTCTQTCTNGPCATFGLAKWTYQQWRASKDLNDAKSTWGIVNRPSSSWPWFSCWFAQTATFRIIAYRTWNDSDGSNGSNGRSERTWDANCEELGDVGFAPPNFARSSGLWLVWVDWLALRGICKGKIFFFKAKLCIPPPQKKNNPWGIAVKLFTILRWNKKFADPRGIHLSEFYLAMAILASILTSDITLTLRLMFGNCFRFFWESTIGSSNFAGKNSETGILWMVQKYGDHHLGCIYKTL